MPEASVDKDSDAGDSKHEIWFADEILITTPPLDPGLPK